MTLVPLRFGTSEDGFIFKGTFFTNIGNGTTSPSTTLDVRGNIAMSLSSRLTIAVNIYSGNTVGHYSLSWYTDPSTVHGPILILQDMEV
jgi:hypothetical protein